MSAEEIKEYMGVYVEMLMYEIACGAGATEDQWYLNFKATGDLSGCPLPAETKKKIKNKTYQLKRCRLDQSFIIWRLMKQKQAGLNSQSAYIAELEEENKSLRDGFTAEEASKFLEENHLLKKQVSKLEKKVESLKVWKTNLIAKLNNNTC